MYFSPYFQEICPNINAEFYEQEMDKRPPIELGTVHRWHRSEAVEGTWGNLT